jgi:hypothetical protein
MKVPILRDIEITNNKYLVKVNTMKENKRMRG